ncbi:MAG: LysR substrate-binding domain-containing protein [Bacteroidales bacterium]
MITDFRLKVFVTVAETMSFTKCADILHISQPAVTKHIKELERHISKPLFIRLGSKIEISEAGKSLLPFARNVLNSYMLLNESVAPENTTEIEGTLRIGASTTISQYLLPRILALFHKIYPKVEIIVLSENSEEITNSLVNQTIDFGIVEDDIKKPSLHYQSWAKDEIVLVTSTLNKKLKEDIIDIQLLTKLPLIVRETGSGTLSVIEHALNQKGITRKDINIQMQLGNSESIIRYLQHSDCYALISLTAVSEALTNNKLRIIDISDINIHRQFRFVYLHGTTSRLIERFKEFCIKNYNQ